MSEQAQTPVVEVPPVETKADASQATSAKPTQVKASPAQDLRDIQYLLLNGIFPGNVAPAVVKGYQLLEQMASKVEKDAEAK